MMMWSFPTSWRMPSQVVVPWDPMRKVAVTKLPRFRISMDFMEPRNASFMLVGASMTSMGWWVSRSRVPELPSNSFLDGTEGCVGAEDSVELSEPGAALCMEAVFCMGTAVCAGAVFCMGADELLLVVVVICGAWPPIWAPAEAEEVVVVVVVVEAWAAGCAGPPLISVDQLG